MTGALYNKYFLNHDQEFPGVYDRIMLWIHQLSCILSEGSKILIRLRIITVSLKNTLISLKKSRKKCNRSTHKKDWFQELLFSQSCHFERRIEAHKIYRKVAESRKCTRRAWKSETATCARTNRPPSLALLSRMSIWHERTRPGAPEYNSTED